MPHVETFDPELERAHRRMDDVERKLQRFNNPTPTIPEYDLQFAQAVTSTTAYMQWSVDTSTAFAPIVAGVDNLIIMHFNRLGNCDVSINGNSDSKVAVDGSQQFGRFAFGTLGGDPFFPVPGSAGAKYSFSNLKIGTSLHGTDIFSDSLSSIPTVPPYHSLISSDFSIVGGKLQVELGGGGANANYQTSPSYDEAWVEFTINFDSSFIDWLTSPGDFEHGPFLAEMYDSTGTSFSSPSMQIFTYAT